jgi:hypothetical protein
MTLRGRLRTLDKSVGVALNARRTRKARERAQLALEGHVAPSISFCPGGKCPFCGKLLKHVTGYFGARRYPVCHHCGRNAYDSIGGVAAVVQAANSSATSALGHGAEEPAAPSRCSECDYEIEKSRLRRCPRCGADLP